jgi:hypothetical protein
MNAIWLAGRLDLPFRFLWKAVVSEDGSRDIPGPETVFTEQYLKLHQSPRTSLTGAFALGNQWNDRGTTRARLAEILSFADVPGIEVELCWAPIELDGEVPSARELRDIWARIGFGLALRRLEALAHEAVPPGSIAVHIRRGDIVHGAYRRGLWSPKFRPFAWFRDIVERFCAEGHTVIVFGDTTSTVDKLCEGLPAMRADALTTMELSGFEAAFFELCAMSACERIVGSESVFATLASMISGTALELPETHIPRHRQVGLVLSDISSRPDRYDRIERAKELAWIAVKRRGRLPPLHAEAFLNRARLLDPGNDLYAILRARQHVLASELGAADALLRDVAEGLFQENGRADLELFAVDDVVNDLSDIKGVVSEDALKPFAYLTAYISELSPRSPQERARYASQAFSACPISDLLRARYCSALIEAGRRKEAREVVQVSLTSADVAPCCRPLSSGQRLPA